MTLKPRRFWLPTIAASASGLLLFLENALHTRNFLNVLNEMLNLPAYIAFQHIAPGRSFYGFPAWFDRGLYLTLVGLCWYLVGVELDFHLLRKVASKWRTFRFCWIAVAVGLQGFVVCVVWLFVAEVIQRKSVEPFDPVASAVFDLIALSWFQLAAVRFWRARGSSAKEPSTSPLSSIGGQA